MSLCLFASFDEDWEIVFDKGWVEKSPLSFTSIDKHQTTLFTPADHQCCVFVELLCVAVDDGKSVLKKGRNISLFSRTKDGLPIHDKRKFKVVDDVEKMSSMLDSLSFDVFLGFSDVPERDDRSSDKDSLCNKEAEQSTVSWFRRWRRRREEFEGSCGPWPAHSGSDSDSA